MSAQPSDIVKLQEHATKEGAGLTFVFEPGKYEPWSVKSALFKDRVEGPSLEAVVQTALGRLDAPE